MRSNRLLETMRRPERDLGRASARGTAVIVDLADGCITRWMSARREFLVMGFGTVTTTFTRPIGQSRAARARRLESEVNRWIGRLI